MAPYLPGPDGEGGPHVFVDTIHAPELAEGDHHHLARSLRLRAGDPLTISDGQGNWRECRFGDRLEVVGDVQRLPRPGPVLEVGFALTKGTKPELVVQKLTELGIDRIQPFMAAHSVARWSPEKATKQQVRLERIGREAAMQSRRVWLPSVAPLADFSTVAVGSAVRAHRAGDALGPQHTLVLVGPEGGWSSAERGQLEEVSLGQQVLRAETAAIVAATLLVHLHRTP